MNQEILLDRPRQAFSHDPDGIPSASIEVSVEAPNGAVEDATVGATTIDSFTSTLVEDSSSGAPWVTLDDSSGVIAGRRYLVGGPAHAEAVVVTEIRGPRVFVRRRLVNAFARGTRFQGCQLSIAVNPAWQRAQARRIELGGVGLNAYRVTWSYRIDGVITRAIDQVDLVFTPRVSVVTPDDVERRYPGWIEALPSEHVALRGTEVIREAHDLVRRDAALANMSLNNAVETRELVERRARIITMEQAVLYGEQPPAELDDAEARYQHHAAQVWSKLPVAPIPQASSSQSSDHIDELRRWLLACRTNQVTQWKQIQALRQWLPRLQTSYECWAAARLIREFITSSRLRDLRDTLLRELE